MNDRKLKQPYTHKKDNKKTDQQTAQTKRSRQQEEKERKKSNPLKTNEK